MIERITAHEQAMAMLLINARDHPIQQFEQIAGKSLEPDIADQYSLLAALRLCSTV